MHTLEGVDPRRRCNTEMDVYDILSPSPTPHHQPQQSNNIITPSIIDSTHDNLLVFEDGESRVRTSTLESVMAVMSLGSGDNGLVHAPLQYHNIHNIDRGVSSPDRQAIIESTTQREDIKTPLYWEMDDKSDVSSLSDFEQTPAKLPPKTNNVNKLSSLFKRPIRPRRLRSEATSAETATTAMHTLETIDNFDAIPSSSLPFGVFTGREELSFLKSAKKVEGEDRMFGSLHGYHRRGANYSTCSSGHGGQNFSPRHATTDSQSSDQLLPRIENSWLIPSSTEEDLIDMEHEISDDMSIYMGPSHVPMESAVSHTVTLSSTCPNGSSAAASIISGSSSPMKLANSTMSTGEQSEHSSKCRELSMSIPRPPSIARARTLPAQFQKDDPTSRLQRIHPAFLSTAPQPRSRPPQISSIDSPCMFGSIAMAEAISPKAISFRRRPSFTNCDGASASVHTPSLPSLEEEDENNASFDSFEEELRRKDDKIKVIGREMKQLFKNLDAKPAVRKGRRLLGLKETSHELKRAEGCLT